ncbi:hypothetical protein [Glacieibacterium frigidum]|uniref:Uncharacterized protein n=1 Tax=Glacieibacterium frigidum TaxID=2593303 RepID=A0A552U8G3_9SPHN|nr:hypothetical protein [Glacieibacterium frigidum]TRW14506.1 hypothetical protein FMM06_12435 [Glacieibacterium frigidum]
MKPAPAPCLPKQLDSDLHALAEGLIASLDGETRLLSLERARLDSLIQEAETAQHRRVRRSARDRACYRVGSAFEPGDGLGLDDVSLTGLDYLGRYGVALLVGVALNNPGARSLSQLLARLFASQAGPLIRSWGAYARWHWMQELYVAETTTFLASPAGRDPKATWRRGSATARQTFLIEEIARVLAVTAPRSMLRGEAFDWIMARGGNPRWKAAPPVPDLPSLGGPARPQ